MTYFSKLKNFNYTFSYKTGDIEKQIEIPVSDIFTRIRFTKESQNNDQYFDYYTIHSEDYTPDKLAEDYYESSSLWWIILLYNDIIDPMTEWLLDNKTIASYYNTASSGKYYYFTERLHLEKNDILIKMDANTGDIDENNYVILDEYDPILRRAFSINGVGTLSENDQIYALRKINGEYKINNEVGFGQTGCYPPFSGATGCEPINGPVGVGGSPWYAPHCITGGLTYASIVRIDPFLEAVVEFSNNGNIISPYSGIPDGDFFTEGNICGLTGAVLYKYMTRDSLGGDISVTKNEDNIFKENDKHRTIKLLKRSIIPTLNIEIYKIIRETVPRGTIIEMR